jgi:predicted PilT family ATPase
MSQAQYTGIMIAGAPRAGPRALAQAASYLEV